MGHLQIFNGLSVPFNIIYHISSVHASTEDMITTLQNCLTEILYHRHIHMYDIPPGHIVLAMGQPCSVCFAFFICRALDKGASTTDFKSLFLVEYQTRDLSATKRMFYHKVIVILFKIYFTYRCPTLFKSNHINLLFSLNVFDMVNDPCLIQCI